MDTDIIDLGLYNPSIEGIVIVAMGQTLESLGENLAGVASTLIVPAIADINDDATGKYNDFQVADLLAATDYLTKLRIACDTYPDCVVRIEQL